MSMQFLRHLPDPAEVKLQCPLSPAAAEVKEAADAEISAIFKNESSKKILLIGPCSVDSEAPVLEYAARLARLAEAVKDKLILVMRVYTNKPRTTGDGYMGMLHQPDPTEKPDLYKGLLTIRALHTRILNDMALPTANEMLYPTNYEYLSDLLSYVAVGARSVENQQHRLTASGIEVPVGMKNPTGGDLGVMMNSIVAAQSSHTFLYRGWEVTSTGNPHAHAILRGYVDDTGRSVSNYHYEDLLRVGDLYAKSGLSNPSVIVDTNHNNSGKKYQEQVRIAKDVVHSRNQNGDIRRLVKGLMIESYLEDGAQSPTECVFGKSITDPCLGWEKTERLILDLAEKL